MQETPLNIVQILAKMYPNCRVGCTNCGGTLEEQFSYVVWHDDQTTENPNPKPTYIQFQQKLVPFNLEKSRQDMWKKCVEQHDDISNGKVVLNNIVYSSDDKTLSNLNLCIDNNTLDYFEADSYDANIPETIKDAKDIVKLITQLRNTAKKRLNDLKKQIKMVSTVEDVNAIPYKTLWPTTPYTG